MTGYKNKTIKQHLNKRVTAWLSTLPIKLREKIPVDVLVCGGAIGSMLLGDEPNDYDIYFKRQPSCRLVMDHYFSMHPIIALSEGLRFDGRPHILHQKDVKFVSENAISLKDNIQLISRFVGKPREIFSNYDFIHTNLAYNYFKDELILHPMALQSLMSKTLIYSGSKYPLASILRIRKFVERGWTISVGQILKITLQLNKLDLSDPVVLSEQLLGVDSQYTEQLIDKLCNLTTGDTEPEVLDELIDNIFDENLKLNVLKY